MPLCPVTSGLSTWRLCFAVDEICSTQTAPAGPITLTIQLVVPKGISHVMDPTTGAIINRSYTYSVTEATSGDGCLVSCPLPPNESTVTNGALEPSGTSYRVMLTEGNTLIGLWENFVLDHQDALAATTNTVDALTCVPFTALLPPLPTLPPSNPFIAAVHAAETVTHLTWNNTTGAVVYTNEAGTVEAIPLVSTQGGNDLTLGTDHKLYVASATVAANLTLANNTTTTLDVLSSTGTDVTLPAATTSLAGLLVSADKTKLNAVTGTNSGDQTATTVPVTASGNLASTNVQAALLEHQGDIDALAASNAAENFFATASTPSSGQGVDGDYHLNVANGDITGPKASGAWPTAGNVGNAFSVGSFAAATLTPTLSGAGGSAGTAARSDHRHAQSRGATLPATDGSAGIIHVLSGHSTLPDGIYGLIGTAWVGPS